MIDERDQSISDVVYARFTRVDDTETSRLRAEHLLANSREVGVTSATFHHHPAYREPLRGKVTAGVLLSWPGSLPLPWPGMEEDSGVRRVRGVREDILILRARNTHYRVGLSRTSVWIWQI